MLDTLALAPIVVSDAEMMQQIGRLRIKAWLADGELPSFVQNQDVWLDEHDAHATNFTILQDGRPIAAARVCIHDHFNDLPDLMSLSGYEDRFEKPIASFNRLVVDPEFRGLGLSKVIDRARMRAALEGSCRSVVVTSHQSHRIHCLERAGFTNLGISRHRTVSYAPSFVFTQRVCIRDGIDCTNVAPASAITIRRLTSADEIASSQSLRYQVWRDESVGLKDVQSQRIADEHDEHAFHWGAFDGALMVGSARLCIHHDLSSAPDGYMFEGLDIPTPVASMNRLVVLRAYRGCSLSSRFHMARIECAQSMKTRTVIATPVDKSSRKEALIALGFVMTGKNSKAKWCDGIPITATYLVLEDVLPIGQMSIFA